MAKRVNVAAQPQQLHELSQPSTKVRKCVLDQPQVKKPYLKFHYFTFSLYFKDDIAMAQLKVGKKPVPDHKTDTYKWERCEEHC